MKEYEKSFALFKDINYSHGIAENLLSIGRVYLKKVDFDKYQEYVQQAYEIFKSENNKRRMGEALYYVVNSYIYKGDMRSAIKTNLEILEIYKELGNIRLICIYNDELGYLYWRIGELEKAFEHWKDAFALSKEAKDLKTIYNSYKSFGLYYYELGNLEKSLEYQFKALETAKEMYSKRDDFSNLVPERFTVIGYIYLRMGEYEKALENIREGKNNLPEKYADFVKAENVKTFGIYYMVIGDYKKAEEFLDEAMEFYESVKRPYDVYEVLHYLGGVYYQKNDMKKALLTYQRSFEMSKQMDDKVSISFNLFELVKIYSLLNDDFNADKYFKQLADINTKTQLATVNLNTKLANASRLKASNVQRNKIKAEGIYEQIIDEKTIWHSHKVFALLSLCELYLEELIINEDRNFLKKINLLVERLLKISEEQNSSALACESLWLQSQLAIFDYDSKKSLHLLSKAEKLAKEKGLTLLATKYKSKLTNLSNFIEDWRNFASRTATVSEINEYTNLNKTINEIKGDRSLYMYEIHKHASNIKKTHSTELQLKQNL